MAERLHKGLYDAQKSFEQALFKTRPELRTKEARRRAGLGLILAGGAISFLLIARKIKLKRERASRWPVHRLPAAA